MEILARVSVAPPAHDHGLVDRVAISRAHRSVEVALAIASHVGRRLSFEPPGVLLRRHRADEKLWKLPLDAHDPPN